MRAGTMIAIRRIPHTATWPIRQTAMWPGKPLEFVKVEGDERAVHYGLFEDDHLLAVISCFYREGEMQFRKFATLPHHQRRGFGTMLLRHVIHEASREGVPRLWCNARADKQGFYAKFGLRATGDQFAREGVAYVTMELKLGDEMPASTSMAATLTRTVK